MASAPPNKHQDKMKDTGTSGDCKKDTEDDCDAAHGACSGACSEETSAKSLNEDFSLEAPDFSFNSCPEADAASCSRNLENQLSDFGIDSRPVVNNGSIGANSVDISLNAVRPGKTEQIRMNILPESGQRVDNTDVPIGIAERQHSFQSRPSCRTSLPPIQNEQPTQESMSGALYNISNPRPVLASQDSYSYLKACDSWDENISLTTQGATVVGAKADVVVNQSNSNNLAEKPLPTSSSMSYISTRSEIPENCLVRRLPRGIISLVATHLQIRQTQGTWKELVELHGWNYQRTYLFQNENHEEGIFFSLLRQPEFQAYTLENLRQDLYNLPRRDVLHDLNEKIYEHNEYALNQRGNPTR